MNLDAHKFRLNKSNYQVVNEFSQKRCLLTTYRNGFLRDIVVEDKFE